METLLRLQRRPPLAHFCASAMPLHRLRCANGLVKRLVLDPEMVENAERALLVGPPFSLYLLGVFVRHVHGLIHLERILGATGRVRRGGG